VEGAVEDRIIRERLESEVKEETEVRGTLLGIPLQVAAAVVWEVQVEQASVRVTEELAARVSVM